MSFRVGIVGSRNFKGEAFVRKYVRQLPIACTVVSGGAVGVDSWAASEARKRGMAVVEYAVDKSGLPKYPKGRGEYARRAFERNKKIALDVDWLVAFRSAGKSNGTDNTIKHCVEGFVPHAILTEVGPERWSLQSTNDSKLFFLDPPEES